MLKVLKCVDGEGRKSGERRESHVLSSATLAIIFSSIILSLLYLMYKLNCGIEIFSAYDMGI